MKQLAELIVTDRESGSDDGGAVTYRSCLVTSTHSSPRCETSVHRLSHARSVWCPTVLTSEQSACVLNSMAARGEVSYLLFWYFNCKKEEKVKTDICIAPRSTKLTSEALRCGSHSFHTANTPHLPLPRKYSLDGATIGDSSHLITAYYSYIDPVRMKG